MTFDNNGYDCILVANYIIDKIYENYDKNDYALSAKRLQRILYLCEVEYMLRNNGKSLVYNDFNVWPSGPVIPKIYNFYMRDQDGKMHKINISTKDNLSINAKNIISQVVNETKKISTVDLINDATSDGTPWFQAKINNKDTVLKQDLYNYYSSKETLKKSLLKRLKHFQIVNKSNTEDSFIINKLPNGITIKQGNQELVLHQNNPKEIYFSSLYDDVIIELNPLNDGIEKDTYTIFENLMKSIFGKYWLSGDYEKQNSNLPGDFINLKNKTITVHLNRELDNILKIEYTNKKTIKISLLKNNESKKGSNIYVRVNDNNTGEDCYLNEFIDSYYQLDLLGKEQEQTGNKKLNSLILSKRNI